jgi:CheY-like chemotaxis protein
MHPLLILDDDPSICLTLAMLFEDEGYDVITFSKGSDALTYLRQHLMPHIIITDYLMPHMNGDEFLRQAHSEFATVPHFYLLIAARSSAQMSETVLTYLNTYQIPYIQKPFDIATILQAVSAWHS